MVSWRDAFGMGTVIVTNPFCLKRMQLGGFGKEIVSNPSVGVINSLSSWKICLSHEIWRHQ